MKDMSFTDFKSFLIAESELRERQRKERMKKAEFEKYAKEHNIFYCSKELDEQIKVETPPILEKIRAEIANLTCDCINGMVNQYAVMQIIDKYAEQEKLMLIEANINGYDQGLKDSSRAEPCEDCDYSEIMDWEQDAKTGKAKPIYWCEKHKEPCEDAVSRQAVINAIENDCMKGGLGSCFASYNDAQAFRGEIEKLPPVRPQEPKAGHWIEHKRPGMPHIECSECSSWFLRSQLLRNSYCPNCGAKMRRENENG